MNCKKSQKFFYGCLFFLLGIALGEILKINLIVFFGLFFAFLPIAVWKKSASLIFIWCAIFVFGIFWNGFSSPLIDSGHISFYNDKEKVFSAVISAEPDVRTDHQKLTVKPIDSNGKVLLKTSLYPEFEYGDLLEVKCFLNQPKQIENFKYDKYLARSGIYSVCYSPEIKLLEKEKGNFFVYQILKLKKVVQRKINATISEPQASFLSGILLGTRGGIPADLQEKFNITGITHVVAISGFNITIIVMVIMNLLKQMYVSRKKAIWFILIGLIFFVILTGGSASVVRAGVMGFVAVWAKHIGRKGNIRNILILSAVIMVFINPKILIWDSGFQLSFLATIGLVYFSPIMKKYLRFVPEKFGLRENLATTLAAIIFTLPLILFIFKRLSLVAPIVNLLILPAIPFSMFFGFIQIIAGFISIPLGQIIGWFSWLLLSYVIKAVEIFSAFPFASVNIEISAAMMLILYFAIIMFMRRERLKN
ncbi:ComEC family competence protein [Patescibacteria group bacterium]|nr:ComEC family competence protein [Patescibacteria group bacterium]